MLLLIIYHILILKHVCTNTFFSNKYTVLKKNLTIIQYLTKIKYFKVITVKNENIFIINNSI